MNEETKASGSLAPVIMLAGGGTGGHISPGLAIAERIRALDPTARTIFACSARPIDASMLSESEAEFSAIRAEPFSMDPRRLIRFLVGLRRGRKDAAALIRKCRPSWVVSLGGFVTPPVVAAARNAGVPVLLVNLDATPGRANRMVARFATRTVSAVPVPSIPIAPASAELCRAELGLDPAVRVLLITGASQGAQSLNELAVQLARVHSDRFRDWQVLHLCGANPLGGVARYERAWRESGVRAAVIPFMHRIGLAWGAADLALSRAGASSVAEAQANQIPTIFAPYPYHKDLHQRENAMPLVVAGAAAMELDQIDADKNMTGLGKCVLDLMQSAEKRYAMRKALQLMPPPDSAEQIAEFVLRGRAFRSSVATA
jgi:UDP-N-acetylglucosamine--N-acetylmuramyl-(pentapeptide) pyrophosphoryl-undecaprenol N-acetylglucosamine transferase